MTDKRMRLLKRLLPFYGIEPERLRVRWVSSAEASELVETISEFVDELIKLGPSPLRRQLAQRDNAIASVGG